jgi:hypothetical protein
MERRSTREGWHLFLKNKHAPYILTLLEMIKKRGFFIKLDTVGTPLLDQAQSIFFKRVKVDKIDAKNLAELVDLIGIPLDGPIAK